MKKYDLKIVLIIAFNLLANNVFCTDQDNEFFDKTAQVYQHCQNNIQSIEESLQSIERSELHLFWTSGRSLKVMLPEYGANSKIHIGGSTYATVFPQTLDALLGNSPKNLIVCLVLDTLTRNSNQYMLTTLQDKYVSRFQILDIEVVKENIVKIFPDHTEIINVIFRNATKGNPAIASDIYRLIGMPYGHNLSSETLVGKQFTYCDVDTFCYGMDQTNHAELVSALFTQPAKLPTNSFYLGRKKGANDLIKIRVSNEEGASKYYAFCKQILDILNQTYQSPRMTVLTYFTKLQDWIQKAQESNAKECFNAYLEEFINYEINTSDIINETGPGFLNTFDYQFVEPNLCYPNISSWAWHGTELLENVRFFNPSLSINSKDVFSYMVRKYCSRIANAFYARSFGEHHPFCIKLQNYLAEPENFPYKSSIFKQYLDYAYKQLEEPRPESKDWLNDVAHKIDYKSPYPTKFEYRDSFYLKLTYHLQKLDIKFSFSKDDIDFLKK